MIPRANKNRRHLTTSVLHVKLMARMGAEVQSFIGVFRFCWIFFTYSGNYFLPKELEYVRTLVHSVVVGIAIGTFPYILPEQGRRVRGKLF